MAKRITVRAPCRIDLAGGWTDVPNFCSKKSGEVVNIAINKYTKCVMEVDDERKITLSYSTDMPTGSGLGTSGSMNVGLIGTILGSGYEATEIAEIAYQFEALLGNKGGDKTSGQVRSEGLIICLSMAKVLKQNHLILQNNLLLYWKIGYYFLIA